MSGRPVWSTPAGGKGSGSRWWIWLVVAALVVVIAGAGAWVLEAGGAEVPDIVGLPLEEAETILVEADLAVGSVTKRAAPGTETGVVLAQRPQSGGAVDPGDIVDLVVAAGDVQVPDVVGLSRAEAVAALAESGLRVGAIAQTPSDRLAPGAVARQEPVAGGTVPWDSAVSLVVARAPTVAVPSVVGLPRGEAESVLQETGLAVGEVGEQETANAKKGTVVNQDPEGGAQVAPGSAVALVVATGSAGPSKVQAPGLIGFSETEMIVVLFDAGLQPGVVSFVFSSEGNAGYVSQQAPTAGTEVVRAALVDVVIVKGSAAGVVPDVAGLSGPDATRVLEAGGFKVTVDRVESGTAPGYVTGQSPASGTKPGTGSLVTLSISRGDADEKSTVPSVAGLELREALAVLDDAGLVPRLLVVQSTRVGDVVAQDPLPGAEVDPGTPVTLRVGAAKRPPTG